MPLTVEMPWPESPLTVVCPVPPVVVVPPVVPVVPVLPPVVGELLVDPDDETDVDVFAAPPVPVAH